MFSIVRRAVAVAVLFAASLSFAADAPAPAAAELTGLLNEFLAGASRNDAAIHDKFWADDLIYTGSGGRRVGKTDIMNDVRSAPAPDPQEPQTVFTAEDVRIHQYAQCAVVAFRLVATTAGPDSTSVQNYLNTGFFVQRGGAWQAAAWQATKKP